MAEEVVASTFVRHCHGFRYRGSLHLTAAIVESTVVRFFLLHFRCAPVLYGQPLSPQNLPAGRLMSWASQQAWPACVPLPSGES